MATTAQHENRLARETSPYLLQHAQNPVDWYPWGREALERAKKEDRPILLSIGYAACHWCHVMERESFENESIARVMNEHFVCIKVDREERPDLDDIYMAATVAMSGHGGWPMTVFLTPEMEPFFAGTYFPPTDRFGRPGFRTLLERLAQLWNKDRSSLLEQARQLSEHLKDQTTPARPMNVSASALDDAVAELEADYDSAHGGFGSAPKFPPSAQLSLLLRRYAKGGEEAALEATRGTLDAMKRGGIYDHLAGGFARYSVDEKWLVPHFEKMLYDNAQLARVYLEAYQLTGDSEYRRVATETLDYIVREMQGPDGGYFSATDADSEGVEGKFFVWTPEEVKETLGEEQAEHFCAYYDVSPGGNWEGVNILNTPRPIGQVARELGIDEPELARSLEEGKRKLYLARKQRVAPLLDDKVLTSWNGLMIGAMAEGHRVVGEPRYLDSAMRAARFVLERMRREDGGLYRTAREGKAHLDAYLEDYAYFIDALIDLSEAGGGGNLIERARELAERMIADFADPDGGAFFHTAKDHERLLLRPREGHDGAVPNANAVAARALGRLSFHLDREDFRERAIEAIRAYGRLIERRPRAFATALGVVDLLAEGPVELVFVGKRTDPALGALEREVARHYLPNRVIAYVDPGSAARATTPLVRDKTPVDGKPALYVCRGFVCHAPVTDPGAVARALDADRAERSASRAEGVSVKRLEGSASEAGTRRYAERFREALGARAFTRFGTTGWTTSRLGFGCYRVDDRSDDHRAALDEALSRGVNSIDTSTNYGDGHSEQLVGERIRALVSAGRLSREEVIVVTKIGYVQGKNLEIAAERKARGTPFSEMVEYDDRLWHCIHAEWLDDQLGRSLARLGLESVDVCLLHNPEYFLADCAKRSRPLNEAREEFYGRLRGAFEHLEAEVKKGRIGFYGVSSNTAVSPRTAPDATDLFRMLAAAREAGGEEHHFRVLQVPMNLLEPEALEQENTGVPPRNVLEVARENEIAVLVNRPLNAIIDGSLVRLAEPPANAEAPPLAPALGAVRELEEQFARDIASTLQTAPSARTRPDRIFRWADQLSDAAADIGSFERWKDFEMVVLMPQLMQAISALDRVLAPSALGQKWAEWRGRYLPALDRLVQAVSAKAAERSRARARALSSAVDPALPDPLRAKPLSQKALATLLGTPGVTAVLVGMRQPDYVADALAALGSPEIEDPKGVFKAARAAPIPGV